MTDTQDHPSAEPGLAAIATQPLRSPVEGAPQAPRLPTATYRIQLHAEFGFRDASRIVPYLDRLGVSDLYTSPFLRARSGSRHGYDVADPNVLNPEIGSEDDYQVLVSALDERGMSQVLDLVPNHMGIGDAGNTRWLDVLENGPSSVHAHLFDIDWSPLKPDLQDTDKVILPVLGDQYGRVLENGELRLSYQDGSMFVHYYELKLPLAPESYTRVLGFTVDPVESVLGPDHELTLELQSIITSLGHLPPRASRDPRRVRERNREKEVVKRRIARLHEECVPFRDAVEAALRTFNGTRSQPTSFDLLDGLLNDQAYRLAFWRVAADEINYRRFFDINDLAAVRVEDPRVFEEMHQLPLELVQAGKVSGLRIDHPDGLRDPEAYLWRLQRSCFARRYMRAAERVDNRVSEGNGPTSTASHADARVSEGELYGLFERLRQQDPASPLLRTIYVVVEKILGHGETLDPNWPAHGTTGYDFLNAVNGLFVERSHRRALDHIYARFTRSATRFRDLANSSKKMVMLISLSSEVNRLGYQLKRIAAGNRRYRDFTLNGLTFAVREIIASLPVYRTYIDPETGRVGDQDLLAVQTAVADAKRRNPRTDPSLFDFVGDVLLLRRLEEAAAGDRSEQVHFVARFQQTSGPVMAKGVEDTAFYVYNRLVSLNDVGGEPDHFGHSVTAFHRDNAERLRHWPFGLLTTSTHDTKRSEDVRARIDVLSELPREWGAALTRWSRLNSRKKTMVEGQAAPDRNEEYLLYQTLLGAWPFGAMGPQQHAEFVARIVAFMIKALREAKVNTSWISTNAPYEAAVSQFVQSILECDETNAFLSDFQTLRDKVAHFGIFNSLSQTLLKLTSPGVPDVYQGSELWDLSLVDPDNRRPVNFETRARALDVLRRRMERGSLASLAKELLAKREDGRVKLYVTHRILSLRRSRSTIFGQGAYLPLRAYGRHKRHVCAFARVEDGESILVAAPVLVAGLTRGALLTPVGEDVWDETWLAVGGTPGEMYRNCFTGQELEVGTMDGKPGLRLAELFASFPVAVLEKVGG